MAYRFTTFDELMLWAEERWPGIVDIMTKMGDPGAEVSGPDFRKSNELSTLMMSDDEGMRILVEALEGFRTMNPISVTRSKEGGPFESIMRNTPVRVPQGGIRSCRENYDQGIKEMKVLTGEWDEDDDIPSA